MIARCLVRQKTSQTFFDYLIPENLQIDPLTLVEVPFGNKKAVATVVEKKEKSKFASKPITRALSKGPIFTDKQYELAKLISYEYLSTISESLFAFLPTLNKRDIMKIGQNSKIHIKKHAKQYFVEAELDNRFNFYFQKVERTKQNLLLLPEVSQLLSAQKAFTKLNPSLDVLVWHSSLNSSEKSIIWRTIQSGKPCLIIATRHGLFLPFVNLENIFLDQHLSFGYFEDQQPAYNAFSAAKLVHSVYNCNLFFGDSFPSPSISAAIIKGNIKHVKIPSKFEIKKISDFYSSDEFIYNFSKAKKILVIGFFKEFNGLICSDCKLNIICSKCSSKIFSDESRFCAKCLGSPPYTCPNCSGVNIRLSSLSLSGVKAKLEKKLNVKIGYNEAENQRIILKSFSQIGTTKPVFDLAIIPFFDFYASFPYVNFRLKLIRAIKEIPSLGAKQIYIISTKPQKLLDDLIDQNFTSIIKNDLRERKEEGLPPFTRYLELNGKEQKIQPLAKIIGNLIRVNENKYIGFIHHSKINELKTYWQKHRIDVKAKLDSPDF